MVVRSRAAAAASVLVALSLATPSAAYADPSSVDHTFGDNGVVALTHSGSRNEILVGLTVLPDGKILTLTDTTDQPAFEVRRLLPDGRPDRSYGGGDGVAAFATSTDNSDTRMAVDPRTGKVYVSTFLDNGTTSPTTVWRLKADGRVDKPFGGGDGHVIFQQRLTLAMLPLSNGRLLMVGNDLGDHSSDVWRLDDRGKPDHRFGTQGRAVLSTDVNDSPTSIVAQPDGRLVVAGSHFDPSASTLMAFRLQKGGAPDRTFGNHGEIQLSPSRAGLTTSTVWSPQVLLRPDGRTAYVAGLNQNNGGFVNSLLVAGLTPRGRLDTTFGKHVYLGISETDSTSALERDGKLVVGGYLPLAPGNDAVFRFTARGALDTTWSQDGTLPQPGGLTSPQVALSPRGRVLLGQTFGATSFDGKLTALRGTKTPSCHGRLATQFGGPGADTLTGTPAADVLVGLGGRDVLKGLAGDDLLCGGSGPDHLIGGSGDDVLYGGPGHDSLDGGSGHNTLHQ